MSQASEKNAASLAMGSSPAGFMLEHFLPYRLALLSSLVSGSIQKLYAAEFDISIPEWRLIAILGSGGPMTANEIRGRAAMDKVQVSRAVAKLADAGHISKQTDPSDRRKSTLSLTTTGKHIFNHIVPLALERETYLTDALTAKEADDLIKLLGKLTERAKKMSSEPIA